MLSLVLSQDFEIICGEELYYNKCRQYLPLQLMNHLIIIREYNLPYWGHWSRASHTLLKTTIGLCWPRMDWSMAPSWGKIKTGPTSSTEITASRTHRTFSKSLESPVFVIHKKTNNRLGLLHDLKGINTTVNQWRTSSQGSLLLLRFLQDITILYLT